MRDVLQTFSHGRFCPIPRTDLVAYDLWLFFKGHLSGSLMCPFFINQLWNDIG